MPTGTVYSIYLRALRELISFFQGTERGFRPSDAVVIEVVLTSHSREFPCLTPVLYPAELMAAVEPFASVSDMWQAHQMCATNAPAINSETNV